MRTEIMVLRVIIGITLLHAYYLFTFTLSYVIK